MQLRPVILALGIMTMLMAAAMVPCALLDYAINRERAFVFPISVFLAALLGALFWVLARGGDNRTGQREAFLLTVVVWVFLPAIGAIPFIVNGQSVTDAMFESVSGLTTTGATAMTGLDTTSKGILLWRAILQWIGGIGIIVTAIAILPQLRVGGMQLFELESSDTSAKFLPRIGDVAAYIGFTYLIISFACAVLYAAAGMGWFDAIAHAMTTVSAGGYSTRDASFAAFNEPGLLSIAIVFMVIAGLPFTLLAMLVLQGRIGPLLKDPQPRLFLSIVLLSVVVIVTYHEFVSDPKIHASALDAAWQATFNIVSVVTGTGFTSAPYDTWGDPIVVLFLFSCFAGGCAGSAACGIKMFRIEIAAKAMVAWSQRMVQPHRKTSIRYGGRIVDEDTLQSVMVFVFLYLTTFLVTAALLSFAGLDALSAISASAASVSNVGPGLGPVVGPSTNFGSLNDFAKWVCAFAMLLGRLEFVAFFVVLTPRFWRG